MAEPESKHDHLEISSSFVSLEEQETAPGNEKQQEIELQSEALPSHEVYEADLPTWRLFVIVGGYVLLNFFYYTRRKIKG